MTILYSTVYFLKVVLVDALQGAEVFEGFAELGGGDGLTCHRLTYRTEQGASVMAHFLCLVECCCHQFLFGAWDTLFAGKAAP